MPEQLTDYRVAVFGSGGVGKTSLVLRFVRGTFKETYIPTIEDTYRQIISSNRQICTLQITDTTGSHQFPAMQRLSITKAHAFILVYSITNKASFDELIPLYKELAAIKKDELSRVPIMVVGNKLDETENREVTLSFGETLAQMWKCGFIETSAKSNVNVKELFQNLLHMETRRELALMGESKRTSRFAKFFKRNHSSTQEPTSSIFQSFNLPKQLSPNVERKESDNSGSPLNKLRKIHSLQRLFRHKSGQVESTSSTDQVQK